MRFLPRLCAHVALTILLATCIALGYPIPPQTLWELTENANLIVVAKVETVVNLDREDPEVDSWADARTQLAVREVWKGAETETVEVAFGPHLVCPAPPRYVEGKTVLAFLRRDNGVWTTVGLSYGTLYPDADELDDFREVVKSALTLQRDGVKGDAKLEWLTVFYRRLIDCIPTMTAPDVVEIPIV